MAAMAYILYYRLASPGLDPDLPSMNHSPLSLLPPIRLHLYLRSQDSSAHWLNPATARLAGDRL